MKLNVLITHPYIPNIPSLSSASLDFIQPRVPEAHLTSPHLYLTPSLVTLCEFNECVAGSGSPQTADTAQDISQVSQTFTLFSPCETPQITPLSPCPGVPCLTDIPGHPIRARIPATPNMP